MIRLALLLAALSAPLAAARPAAEPEVRLETSAGPITLAIDVRHAPITGRNFLRYVDEHRFDGTSFYRAARGKRDPKTGLVQGGINHFMPKSLPPIAHEPTGKTGLRHIDGTLSMARNAPGTAMGDFFIVVGPGAYLDEAPNYPGYAAFGHVVRGMDVVRAMLAAKTYPGGWDQQTIGQSLVRPVKILRAVRVR
ncbi:peptidylprolyl isomerase [Sphingomonas morindae]|uniref:peptidylprolyl isomerase n=1 Tax=Sphingomonas morindae TaxID=1541170 RepID=A0ABY4X4S3_9SPHN|nr:peptidylprolyl isomerase [Sphingomonas morindae]USI71894.1 peptidylprolyl isomerase [Sphingomonas morindae]